MKKINKTIFSLVFSLSIIWGDATEAVTELVGRNAEGYLGPIGTILGTDMNSGFYRKASPHKILGFDFTFDIVYAMTPTGAGQTTYEFLIPDQSLAYNFKFEFPKSYLMTLGDNDLLQNIPDANTDENPQYNDDGLFQDIDIGFDLPLDKLLTAPTEPAQNILGNSTESNLDFDFSVAGEELFNQIVSGTWSVAKNIDGIGKDYEVIDKNTGLLITIIPAAFDSISFRNDFAENEDINGMLESTLTAMNISLPIPGGIGEDFEKLPFPFGIPMPILQASFGLPFHTEITVRGLPVAQDIPSFGSVKFGGFGGKIGISEFFKEKPKKQPKIQISPKIKYVLEELPSNITPADIDSALAEIRSTSMDLTELDDLNNQFHSGDSMAVYDILPQLEKISTIPKRKKSKPKGWPVDVSIGYYTNDLILDMGDAKINSKNNLLSLQVGKTLNLPFISFLGGVGLYGGLGLESSDLNLKYTLANPIAYGCFTGSGDSKTYLEDVEKDNCSGGAKEWGSGVPTDISLSFPGENKFRTTIGARVRVLFVDVYVDYNTGTSNAINAGVGITFR